MNLEPILKSLINSAVHDLIINNIIKNLKQEAALPGLYFTSPPDREEPFQVGDHIEVFCDHDHSGNRIRDWLEGTVVQVDPKLLAIQFQENVYLTDGWMVPDHVLWCPKDSHNIRRSVRRKRRVRPRPIKIDD